MKNTITERREAQKTAERIRTADTWNPDDCAELCRLAGLSEDWTQADGDTFEAILNQAANRLNVEIL